MHTCLWNSTLGFEFSQLFHGGSQIKDKSKRYEVASEIEVSLTESYFLFGKHLNYGVLDSIHKITELPRKTFTLDMPKYLAKAYKSDSLIEKLYSLQPDIPQYKRLQKGLSYYLSHSSMSTDNMPVKSFRVDSVKAIVQSKKALVLHKYLDSVVSDSLYFIALKKFQLDHALKSDGLIGNNTAKALSMSPYDYYLKLVANLEMWRWKEPLESNHIFVNIPSYKLELSQDNKVTFESRVVVGKKKNETPEIKDSLSYIIAYPYWNVPRKISLEEVVLKARRDSTYFKRNNFELLNYNRTSVDVSTIDWKAINKRNFKYYVRQRGGGSNSLGLVKFIFPNKYAVYLHDTPSKSHFNREIRAYSHGCVRVEKPMALAEHLLAGDKNKNDIDSVYKFIKKRKEKPLKLNKKVAVYIYYFTADADENGKVTLYQDIYDIDRKLTHLLIQKRNEFKS